ncbi:hypothetical protein [Glutamicibacter sp.]|jgi:hypothetical protein|uniref:hypothetical protein n=1 Tax=Glutamicibacter sp. TaxID=1931995 RepID=UPI002B45B39D|nr:hypothetical protein [Glutamicibacter sp.]HJX77301.1 hypothetical protein [Glutamicibacter sp.]
MSESYIKAEIVSPALDSAGWFGKVFMMLFLLAFRTLIIWWFAAAWFPELGLTYWQLVLAVYAARCIFGNPGVIPRVLKK